MPLKFSGPDIGELPRFGLRGADDGEYILAGDGPVEQYGTSEVGRGMTDIVHQKEEAKGEEKTGNKKGQGGSKKGARKNGVG